VSSDVADRKGILLAAPNTSSTPDFGYAPTPKRVRILWKLSSAVTAVILIFYVWQCGSAITEGRRSANQLVQRFHQLLNGSHYEQIAQESDQALLQEEKQEDLVTLLAAVHTKLGDVAGESLTNMSVNAGTDGTFVKTEYKTTYSRGSAVETFTWIKRGGTLKLYGYNIQSNAFLSR
jgi:hypothetical protein